jgi:hypothetical protein
LGEDLGIAPRRVRRHAVEIGDRTMRSREAARESLPTSWRDAPIIAVIDEIVAEFADVLRRAADEPR